jgi:hypothetical protein
MLIFLWSLLVAPIAHAGSGPYMWGVGPMINTIVLPGEHPVGFPKDTRIKDEDGKNQPLLDKTLGDVGFGVHGVLYMKRAQRLSSHAWYSTGAGKYRSPNFTFEYDFAGQASSGVTILGGLGAGLGHQKWTTESAGTLKMNHYILRAQGAANYRTKKNCFELGAYMNWYLPGRQLWDAAGDVAEERVKGGFYPTLGVELTAFFGDFRPPKNGKGKKSKKKKGGRR